MNDDDFLNILYLLVFLIWPLHKTLKQDYCIAIAVMMRGGC